jgi:hypothetical protein
MPKVILPPTENEIALVSTEYKRLKLTAVTEGGSREPDVFTVFNKVLGVKRRAYELTIQQFGGKDKLIERLNRPDDELKSLYSQTIQYLKQQMLDRTLDSKVAIELLKLIGGNVDKKDPLVSINIGDFLSGKLNE